MTIVLIVHTIYADCKVTCLAEVRDYLRGVPWTLSLIQWVHISTTNSWVIHCFVIFWVFYNSQQLKVCFEVVRYVSTIDRLITNATQTLIWILDCQQFLHALSTKSVPTVRQDRRSPLVLVKYFVAAIAVDRKCSFALITSMWVTVGLGHISPNNIQNVKSLGSPWTVCLPSRAAVWF